MIRQYWNWITNWISYSISIYNKSANITPEERQSIAKMRLVNYDKIPTKQIYLNSVEKNQFPTRKQTYLNETQIDKKMEMIARDWLY